MVQNSRGGDQRSGKGARTAVCVLQTYLAADRRSETKKKTCIVCFLPKFFAPSARLEYRVCYVFTSLMQNMKVLHFHTSLASVLPCLSTPMTTSTVQCVISTYYVPYGASGNQKYN